MLEAEIQNQNGTLIHNFQNIKLIKLTSSWQNTVNMSVLLGSQNIHCRWPDDHRLEHGKWDIKFKC